MIAYIGNRPAIQVGNHQILDYNVEWLETALERAARAAGCYPFPLQKEIRKGIEFYLENQCALKLLRIEDLFLKMQKMLSTIGCGPVADALTVLAPPLTISLIPAARAAENGFELLFYETIRAELKHLEKLGVEQIEFTGLKECVLILGGDRGWDRESDRLQAEISSFLKSKDRALVIEG